MIKLSLTTYDTHRVLNPLSIHGIITLSTSNPSNFIFNNILVVPSGLTIMCDSEAMELSIV